MKLKILAGLFAAFSVAGVMAPLPFADHADAAKMDKVTICHSTRSEKNPYVIITVSGNSIPKAHSVHHDGDDLLFGCGGEGE